MRNLLFFLFLVILFSVAQASSFSVSWRSIHFEDLAGTSVSAEIGKDDLSLVSLLITTTPSQVCEVPTALLTGVNNVNLSDLKIFYSTATVNLDDPFPEEQVIRISISLYEFLGEASDQDKAFRVEFLILGCDAARWFTSIQEGSRRYFDATGTELNRIDVLRDLANSRRSSRDKT